MNNISSPFKMIFRIIAATVFISLLIPAGISLADDDTETQEVNIVFLHGMGGTTCTLQNLADQVYRRFDNYSYLYEQDNPGITLELNTLQRCYEGYTDIDSWAKNIAQSIEEHFEGKDNIILVGHSMGGKTALYAVANNILGIADKVSAIVTINSPVKYLGQYYPPGGGPPLNYCSTILLGSDDGVCSSVINYDSSADGLKVSEEKHWLAFISAESSPFSSEFDRSGVDTWPHEMDDGVVPLSAQYADGADVVYYGQSEHSGLGEDDETANTIADNLMRYIFGYPIECSEFSNSGTFEHEADWLLGEDTWVDYVGNIIDSTGIITHKNESYTSWEEWDDVVGNSTMETPRSTSIIKQNSLPLLTSIGPADWTDTEDTGNGQLQITTKAAPRVTVTAEWTVYRRPLLEDGEKRTYYEVSITEGTPLTTIKGAAWTMTDTQDTGLTIISTAQSPFRWFSAEWRVFKAVSKTVKLIDEIISR